ncbi:MAG: hypothetical protein COU35_04865 [Candidatus Magasanikbacteria bacterium CG10_big_fil_rev_8_21_14_0_10_47_10]|uniref:DUF11 domain-containing protein n=1 Tax=Candidatus Magasanikbacteria bacterium CG10_big_fil_rev_8_21_14_0_10_47_10 TaxID=1974652 RepID=A0A2H0TPA0_9BACT|nr:MAG: hypothetical protein COU35_04865 [Candidatus Magasanikbacteria bacterium CG10_big_fil_rev_8_21_14_0_10_47_10]
MKKLHFGKRQQRSVAFFTVCLIIATAFQFQFEISNVNAAASRIKTVAAGNAGATTVTASWPSATTAGNFLVAIVAVRGGSGTTITPPSGGWILATRSNNGTNISTAIYYIANAPAQSGASTWGVTPTNRATVTLAEYSGVATSAPLDVIATATGNSATGSSGTTAITSQANALAIAGISATSGNRTFSAQTNSFTEVSEVVSTGSTQGTRNSTVFEEKILSSTGTQGVSATISASGNWAGVIAVFKGTNPTFEQSSYRIFQNSNSAAVGSPLALQNAAVTLGSHGTAFRLRSLIHVNTTGLPISGQNFKLQYALRSGTCDTSFAGESYSDVTAATTIAYNDNAAVADGIALTLNASDPIHGGDTLRRQTYEEANNFINSTAAIGVGEDGMWDFSLKDNGAAAGASYCFRIVKSDNTLLDTYSFIPEISIPVVSDLAVSKTVNNANPSVGDTIQYTLTVSNSGPETATAVSLVDVVPAGLTYVSDDGSGAYNSVTGLWTIGTLTTGANAILHISAAVNTGSGGQTITNTTSNLLLGQTDPNTANNIGSQAITVKLVTVSPVVSGPITAGNTFISGTSSEVDGTTVEVFVNGISVGTAAVTSGAWSRSVAASELQAGEEIKARALASGKSISVFSNTVIADHAVSPAPSVNSPITAADTTISGSSSEADGTVIGVYVDGNPVGSTTVVSNSWSISVAASELQADEDVSAKATIDTNNDGLINGSDNASAFSTPITISELLSHVPAINAPITAGDTTISGTSIEADGTVITIYVNASLIGQTTVSAGTWLLSVSETELDAGEHVTAKATIDTNNDGIINGSDTASAPSSTVIVDAAPIPTDVPNISSPITAGDTSVSGLSTENDGTTVEVFVDGLSIGTTLVTGGTWSLVIPSSELQAGEHVKANAIAAGEILSAFSSTVTVLSKISAVPTVNSPIVAGDTTISGTSNDSDGTTIEVFVNAGTVDSTTVLSGIWSLSVSTSELQALESVTAKATIDTNNDGTIDVNDNQSFASTAVVVSHTAPAAAPQITGPVIAAATTITGLSVEANGTVIYIRVGGTMVGSGTVSSGSWSVTVGASELQADEGIIATALKDTNNDGSIDGSDIESSNSTSIVVGHQISPVPQINSPIFSGSVSISGLVQNGTGTQISLYRNGIYYSGGVTVNGNWSFTLPSTLLIAGDTFRASSRIDTNNDGTINGSDQESTLSSGVTVTDMPRGKVSSQIFFPQQTGIQLNDGHPCSASREIILTLHAIDAVEVFVTNDEAFQQGTWLPFNGPDANMTWQLPNSDGQKNVYAQFRSSTGHTSQILSSSVSLDTITSCGTQPIIIPPVEEIIETTTTPSEKRKYDPIQEANSATSIDEDKSLVTTVERLLCDVGSLLKTADDGAIYYCGRDGKKHAFPHSKVFFTWYSDYTAVQVVANSILHAIPIGSPVTYKPGVRMLKLPSDSKTYAISGGGVLHWITTEIIAQQLYGAAWNKLIDDVNEIFFSDYVIGDPITADSASSH